MLIPGRIPLLFPGKRQPLKAGGIDKGYASCTIPSVKHMVDENVDLPMLISNSWHGGMTLTLSLDTLRSDAAGQKPNPRVDSQNAPIEFQPMGGPDCPPSADLGEPKAKRGTKQRSKEGLSYLPHD